VVSAIVIAVACGTWPTRAAASAGFAVLVTGDHIFGGLSHLGVAAVGHLTALVTATAAVTLTLARRRRVPRETSEAGTRRPGHVTTSDPIGRATPAEEYDAP
jgi:hypothetical protein